MKYWNKYCNETEWPLEKKNILCPKNILKKTINDTEKQQLVHNSAKIADIDK